MSRIRELRINLRNELTKINTESWNEMVKKVDQERNKSDFWKSIKRIYAKKEINNTNYLKNHHNEKNYTAEGRENIFRGHWSKIFNINDEENEEFDRETDRIVEAVLERERELIMPNIFIDNNRENIITIDTSEIIETIKSFKQKAPL